MHGLPEKWLDRLSEAPFPLRTLLAELGDYSQPLFKIHQLVKDGVLIRLKRGFFCVNPEVFEKPVSNPVVANSLYAGPSYISLEYALSFYGLIPERVMGMTSVVTGRSRHFKTPIGWFNYKTIPESLFGFGVRTLNGYLMATPEKALCDYLFTRKNLRIAAPKTLQSYLEEDVRFDFDSFVGYDPEIFKRYAAAGYKKELFSAAERLFS